jgi:hypothetical protein
MIVGLATILGTVGTEEGRDEGMGDVLGLRFGGADKNSGISTNWVSVAFRSTDATTIAAPLAIPTAVPMTTKFATAARAVPAATEAAADIPLAAAPAIAGPV